jgi:hypothetical protein
MPSIGPASYPERLGLALDRQRLDREIGTLGAARADRRPETAVVIVGAMACRRGDARSAEPRAGLQPGARSRWRSCDG